MNTIRQQLRDEVAAIKPLDALEAEHQRDTLTWIDSGAQLWRLQKPATPPKHLVSYVVVVDGDYVLLVDHTGAQLWLPTGGHVDPEEHPRAAAARELQEELGLTPPSPMPAPLLLTCAVTVGLTAGHTDVSLWYVVNKRRSDALTYSQAEFLEARWFALADAPLQRSDPHMGRFLQKLSMRRADTTGRG